MTVAKEKKLCGAKKRGEGGGACTRPAGWGTDHPSIGRCKLHSGSVPIKSGRYSRVKRTTLREAIDRYKNDPELLDLKKEVGLLRALVDDVLARKDEIDYLSLASLVDKVGSMVDRIHRHNAKFTISVESLNRVMEQFGVEVFMAIKEVIPDVDTRAKVVAAVDRRWSTVRIPGLVAVPSQPGEASEGE